MAAGRYRLPGWIVLGRAAGRGAGNASSAGGRTAVNPTPVAGSLAPARQVLQLTTQLLLCPLAGNARASACAIAAALIA
jgi:hypothetical protein